MKDIYIVCVKDTNVRQAKHLRSTSLTASDLMVSPPCCTSTAIQYPHSKLRESLDRPCRYQSHGIGKGYTGGFHEYFGPDADIDSGGPELVSFYSSRPFLDLRVTTYGSHGGVLTVRPGSWLGSSARSHLFDACERLDSPRGALCSHSWRGQASASRVNGWVFWGFSP